MKCPSCDSENKDGRKFCANCGGALPLSCPACGFVNEHGDRFCGGCGTELADAAAAETAALPEDRAAERRQVTILFVDISGFTPLSKELGGERTHQLLERFFEIVDGIVIDYGGTIDKHIGDAVMALFGAPVAHSNDPERAVRAALEVHARMQALAAEFGREIRTHNGVASGQVVASGLGSARHREYTVLGDSVNLASRLADRAEPGETLISDDVAYAIHHIVDADDIGAIELKGIAEPVTTWRLSGLRDQARGDSDMLFVGRREELARFDDIVAACRGGEGHTIYLRGEAGIGKSRLGDEFKARAKAAGFDCHAGQALDFGAGGGHGAVRDIIRSILGLGAASATDDRLAATRACLDDGSLKQEQLAFLFDLLEIPLEADMRVTYDAIDNSARTKGKTEVIADLLSWHANAHPLLLLAEDLHWAQQLAIDHLAGIAAATSALPIILVLTSRFDGDPLDRAWRDEIGNARFTAMDLKPLGEDDALKMTAVHADISAEIARGCIDRAEGNPLFLEQLLHSALTNAGEAVPGTVSSIVLARVDGLSEADRKAIQAASVLGQHFIADVVRHLTDDDKWGPDALLKNRLVRRDGGNLRFAHALVWEGVYATLLGDQQRRLHRLAATWFASRDPILRAEHLDRAEDHDAAAAFLDAARDERQQFRFERAAQLAGRGLELARDSGDRYDLLMLGGECQTEMGQPTDAIASYREALQSARTDVARCRAWLGLAGAMRVTDEFEEGLAVLDQAEAAAQGDKRLLKELSHVHYLRGSLYFPLGNLEGCMAEHEKALAIGREADCVECEARALSGLGDAHYSQGRMVSALDYFRDCVFLCQEHGFGRIEFSNRYMIGWNRLYLSEIIGSYEDSMVAAEAAGRAGHARGEMVARLAAGRALFELGRLDEADENLERGKTLAQSLGARRFEPFLQIYKTRVALARSGPGAGLAAGMAKALEISRETGFGFLGPWVLSTLALAGDDPGQGRKALKEGVAALAGECVGHNYFAFYRDAMEFSLRHGEWDKVDEYAGALSTYSKAEPLPFCEYFIARGKALAAHGRDGADDGNRAVLLKCRQEAQAAGMAQALPALDEALDG